MACACVVCRVDGVSQDLNICDDVPRFPREFVPDLDQRAVAGPKHHAEAQQTASGQNHLLQSKQAKRIDHLACDLSGRGGWM